MLSEAQELTWCDKVGRRARSRAQHGWVLALPRDAQSSARLPVCPGSKEHGLTVSLSFSKEQGPTPVEKKKKGKRKNEIPVDTLELDQDLLSPSVQSPEESVELADSQVWHRDSTGRPVGTAGAVHPCGAPLPLALGPAELCRSCSGPKH